jgi:hypothetical protein
MQTLFGFELGNYYRSVTPLPLQTEFPLPHHILLIPPQSLRKQQSRLTNQGCSGLIRIHCRSWDLVGSSRGVFLEGEEVISCLIVLCVFIIITSISHVSVVCPSPPFTYLARKRTTVESIIMGYIPTTCYFDLMTTMYGITILTPYPQNNPNRPECISLV